MFRFALDKMTQGAPPHLHPDLATYRGAVEQTFDKIEQGATTNAPVSARQDMEAAAVRIDQVSSTGCRR